MALPEPIQTWLTAASADAERRGLPALKLLLDTLAHSTATLRAADAARARGERRDPRTVEPGR